MAERGGDQRAWNLMRQGLRASIAKRSDFDHFSLMTCEGIAFASAEPFVNHPSLIRTAALKIFGGCINLIVPTYGTLVSLNFYQTKAGRSESEHCGLNID